MITFKSIKAKNFLSIGDQFTEIQLNKSITSLVTGQNGSGKSTLIDALVYSLFGKPFRKIRLGQLINKVNVKGLSVEIEFSIGAKNYKIIRGQKPAIFEIWVNGEMIEQPSNTADYQRILENEILKLNFKTFTQIIILGSASYIPFMKLSLGDRREIIENLLDISVFSAMNKILKEKIKAVNNDIIEANHNKELANERYKTNKIFLAESKKDRDARDTELQQKITDISGNIISSEFQCVDLKKRIDEINVKIKDYEGSYGGLDKLNKEISSLEIKIAGDKSTYNSVLSNYDINKKNKIVLKNNKNKIKENEKLNDQYNWILTDKNDEIRVINEKLELFDINEQEIVDIKSKMAVIEDKKSNKLLNLKFYESNDTCPECDQKIDATFKSKVIYDINYTIGEYDNVVTHYKSTLKIIENNKKEYNDFIKDKTKLEKECSEKEYKISLLNNSIISLEKMNNSIKDNSSKVLSKKEIDDLKKGIDGMKESVHVHKKERDRIKVKINMFEKLSNELSSITKKLAVIENQVLIFNNNIIEENKNYENLLKSPICSVTDEDIKVLFVKMGEFDAEFTKKNHTLHYYKLAQRLLKDDGLKTRIISKFLPIINALMNKYLDILEFPISFEFDENFNETIQSKFRNDFSYYSFSEGEKARIDLALLFTWRELALNKSRSSTNIIIFDEIFQSSLDSDGINNFLDILGMDTYNTFIISHDSDIKGSEFNTTLKFEKKGHFSKCIVS